MMILSPLSSFNRFSAPFSHRRASGPARPGAACWAQFPLPAFMARGEGWRKRLNNARLGSTLSLQDHLGHLLEAIQRPALENLAVYEDRRSAADPNLVGQSHIVLDLLLDLR
jgi:hypothetical protein